MNLLSEELFVHEEVGVSWVRESTFKDISTTLDENVSDLVISLLAQAKLNEYVT